VQVDLGGLDRLVSEPERDHRAVDAGLEELHRSGVPKDVRRDPLTVERGASLRRGRHMASQQALYGVWAESAAMDVGEQLRRAAQSCLLEPGRERMARLTGERSASLLAALAEAADMGAGAQNDGALVELDDLGQAQAALAAKSSSMWSRRPIQVLRSGAARIASISSRVRKCTSRLSWSLLGMASTRWICPA